MTERDSDPENAGGNRPPDLFVETGVEKLGLHPHPKLADIHYLQYQVYRSGYPGSFEVSVVLQREQPPALDQDLVDSELPGIQLVEEVMRFANSQGFTIFQPGELRQPDWQNTRLTPHVVAALHPSFPFSLVQGLSGVRNYCAAVERLPRAHGTNTPEFRRILWTWAAS